MARFVLIDFETESAIDLKKAGAWRYSEDFSTGVVCLGYNIDGLSNELWVPGTPVPASLWRCILDPGCLFYAFNCGFEKPIWRNIMVRGYGWPDIPNERWHDPQSVCAMKGIPLKLDAALRALDLGRKDVEGTSTVLTFSRFDKQGRLGGDPATRPARLERTYIYCRDNDVPQELALHRRIGSLGAAERKVWLLDQSINERGIRLDMAFVKAAQHICEDAAGPLLKEFQKITGVNPTQRDQFLLWLRKNGATIPDLKKETLDEILGAEDEEDDSLAGDGIDARMKFPEPLLRPLKIRRILGSASIKKLARMSTCVSFDGRARGLLQYHGAGPGRWAGRLLQPQNFPRPTLQIDNEAIPVSGLTEAILTGDAEYVRALWGEPIEAVANGLRHALIPDKGKEFVVGDFATVEARIVLAIAGQYDKVNLIAGGQDIYIDMAQTIFDQVVTKKEHPELRQAGKSTVLGAGFQMGAPKFQARYAKDKSLEFAKKCIAAYREDFAPLVPKLWYGLERAAILTVWEKTPQEFMGIVYALEDGFLTCRLPSGRKLWYYNPTPVRRAMPWDENDIRRGFKYRASKMGKSLWVDAYGGLLTENVVQATARDLMVAAMFKCEENGLPIVLTVHDEIVAETEHRPDNEKTLMQIMCEGTDWSRALKIPVGAEIWSGDRYRK